jgi:hypothetical protein
MANRGRPKKEITKEDLERLNLIDTIPFHTKKQQAYLPIKDKRSNFTDDEIILLKENLRLMNTYSHQMDLLMMIQQKAKTAIPLTQLEKEILGYNWSDRDGYFNCLHALTTYSKLEKIAKSEIQRIENQSRQEAIQKSLKQQTDGQIRRKVNERRKYFLGGVVLKYVDFLRENHLYSVNESEETILKSLIEDSIICTYLSDVTNNDVRKANDVKNSIKNNHSDIIEKIRAMSEEIVNDKRR